MGGSQELKLVEVSTDCLKDKLNKIYDVMRARPRSLAGSGLFEYLWDLKEAAIMEGRGSVQVPTNWLKEIEDDLDLHSATGATTH